jgi:radical SAM protein with 4Fe4S-binding SPASM domain
MKRSVFYYLNRFLRDKVDYTIQPERAWARPTNVWLETNKLCNLKCQMCARELETRFHAGGDSSEEVFRQAGGFFRVADTVTLYGWNEPLLDKKLFEKIEKARKAGANVHFNTNGTLLTEDKAERLIDLKVSDIGISLDGATRETFEQIRVGADFEKIKQNVRGMVALKEKKKAFFPYMHIVFCALGPNIEELPRMPKVAREVGLGRIDVTDTVFYKPDMVEKLGYDPEKLLARVEEAKQRGRQLGVEVRYWPYDNEAYLKRVFPEKVRQEPGERLDRCLCHELYKTMIVLANGDVVPCHFQWGEKAGSIRQQSLEEIWNGSVFRKLRRDIRQGQPPPVCRRCPYLKKPGDRPGVDVL